MSVRQKESETNRETRHRPVPGPGSQDSGEVLIHIRDHRVKKITHLTELASPHLHARITSVTSRNTIK